VVDPLETAIVGLAALVALAILARLRFRTSRRDAVETLDELD
jgi:hypothetical protein